MVRASLVRFLGGTDNAVLWARIDYRGKGDWWRATLDDIAEETGMSRDQIQRAVNKLIDLGVIEREKLRQGGISDHTYSYRVVIQGREIDVAESRDQDVAESRDLPSVREVKKKTLDDPGFENAWKHWPNKNAKKAAQQKFLAAIIHKKINRTDLEREIIRHGEAFRTSTTSDFTPYLSTWLNQERWTDPLGTPRIPAQQPGWTVPPVRKIHDPRVDGPVNPYRNEV